MSVRLFVCALLLFSQAALAAMEVRVSDSRQSNIYMDALVWLLDKSGEEYQLIHTDHPTSTQKRKVIMLRQREIDVIYAGFTEELGDALLAIRYPITRGLIGNRLLVIHQQQQADYAMVKSLQDLQQHAALLGFGWPEVALFTANRMPVYERIYDEIFVSMDRGHTGYFSRGILEVYGELHDRPELTNLMIEPHILLRYPSAVFFYVHPENQALAQALQRGFELGYEDGSYLTFFYNHPLVKQALQRSNLPKRWVIDIEHPWFNDIYHSIPADYWHSDEP
ncbi:hypothetical protein CHH28_02585 [Bacterioplanes sanyensis]|uniref:Solute-binding protein family 3/N-terminal domain-containing protein n=1 Tax=Bacterioplanes sanyensis TaxID=1249553 RepID=A0A222FHB1_9GAMM|nr:hypothetical protein [Bacterioplanes sanyensis]ASP37623.1 hypothetical protein CHH28_02585 [Bacterioplanes sanyensis]